MTKKITVEFEVGDGAGPYVEGTIAVGDDGTPISFRHAHLERHIGFEGGRLVIYLGSALRDELRGYIGVGVVGTVL